MIAHQDTKLDWYLDQLRIEISNKFPVRFHGSIDVQFNIVDGNIVNISMSTKKSLKFALQIENT